MTEVTLPPQSLVMSGSRMPLTHEYLTRWTGFVPDGTQ